LSIEHVDPAPSHRERQVTVDHAHAQILMGQEHLQPSALFLLVHDARAARALEHRCPFAHDPSVAEVARLGTGYHPAVPELPEVEVTRRAVRPLLLGRTVTRVWTSKPSYFFLTPPKTLQKRLLGRRFTGLDRRGKYLVANLDDGSRLLLHLGMTGQLVSSSARSRRLTASAPHIHLVLSFSDGGPALVFRDVRKFGKVRHIPAGKGDPRLDRLGTDALEVSGPILYAASRKRRIPIKSLLLDQSVIAGAGNIYADEALFAAKIRPTRRSSTLTRLECDHLSEALRRVLRAGIEAGGSSIDDFVRPDGRDGSYQEQHRVYGRGGQPCPRCRTPIRRVVLGARSSSYCPACQR
jgi:formamidopyrimidine-DNA glycosylase